MGMMVEGLTQEKKLYSRH